MKSRRFQPVAVDVMEDRLLMTVFTLPFTIVKPPANEVNPKFLFLTGRTESEISSAIPHAFHKFSHTYLSALNAYDKSADKPGVDSSTLFARFNSQLVQSFNGLLTDLSDISYKVPFGHVNLNPVLQTRINGAPLDPIPSVPIPTQSLRLILGGLGTGATPSEAQSAINTAEADVTTDVNDYINLGVTNGDFKLTRGAKLPALS